MSWSSNGSRRAVVIFSVGFIVAVVSVVVAVVKTVIPAVAPYTREA